MKTIFLVLACLILPLVSSASEKALWVESEGEAFMSEVETSREVMARAKMVAQNKAIEQVVGVFLKSHALVSNSQLAEDLIYIATQGKIQKVEIIKEGWDPKDRNLYKVRLRALVEPVHPEKGKGISIKLALSKSELREGGEVKIFYQTDADCYAYLFSIAADGSVTLLLPNSTDRDNAIRSGVAYEFPAAGSPIHLKAMFLPDHKGNMAEERIKLIVTRKKEDLVPLGFREGMFKVYDAGSTGMISDLTKKLNQLEPSDWMEATTTYRLTR
jgi:hypothetical protein